MRDNFVRFARMKHERGAKVQVVVQMVRMERNAGEVDDFVRFWSAVPGVDQVRIKEDETNVLQPEARHAAQDWKHPCHYLWRGPMYVKQNGDVYPCCQSYTLDGGPVGNIGTESLPEIWNSDAMQRMRELHVTGRAGEIDVCARCCTTIPSGALVAGSSAAARPHRTEAAAVGGTPGLFLETAAVVTDAAAQEREPKYRRQRTGPD